jgi:flagellar protein FliJ
MDHVLPVLIRNAVAARDRQQALSRVAAAAQRQAGVTLERLQQFRGDCLARSPAASQRAVDAQALIDYQHFVARLDDAIAMQGQECSRGAQRSEFARQQLLESQRRLMSFESLVKRRAQTQAAAQGRRDQRDTDEFAARAARRVDQETRP